MHLNGYAISKMLREDRQVAVTWSVEQVVHTGRRTQITFA